MRASKAVSIAVASSLLMVVVTRVGADEVFFTPPSSYVLSPAEQEEARKRDEQARLQREKLERLQEQARVREQAQVDAELARLGWPKSREAEARDLIRLRGKAASLAPKAGAGALLIEPGTDAQDYWARKQMEDSDPTRAKPSGETQKTAETKPSEKSKCWTVDAPPKVAVGFSRESEADARTKALSGTKGCKIVAEVSCDSRVELQFNKNGTLVVENGKLKQDGRSWDCRASYHCGEERTACEHKSAAGSKQ